MRFAPVAGLLVLALAQDQSQPPPRFRTGVDVVLLDVAVLDTNRRPVRGLTAGDFTILEDGNPQRIVSFEELSAPEPDGALVPWMRDVAPDIRTNAADDRRIILMILDDANINFRYRETVRNIGRRIVDQLGPADQASVTYTGNNARSQEFTNDRKVLRGAVDRYVDTSIPSIDMRQQYAVQTVRRAAQSLIAIPHRRKAMILVSSLAVNPADLNSDAGFQLQQALRTAQEANVTIYPINPAGLEVMDGAPAARSDTGRTLATTVDPGRDPAADTARVIASHTGGFAVTNSNTFDAQIGQIFRETGSYYLIGFQTGHRDGKFRRLEVRTRRAGLTVRTRNGYNAPKPEKEAKAEKAGAVPLPLVKSLSDVLPNPDMPMRVTVAPFAMAGKNTATVTIVLGVQQPAPRGDQRVAEKVEVISTAFDTQYRSRAWFRQTAQMTLRPVEGSEDAKYEILSKLTLNPGRYNLRFAVHSASMNKSGSVYQDIEVPDFSKAPVSLSGVVVSVNPALPSAPKDFLSSVIPLSPTTQRVFMRGHRATAFLRVYQGGRRPPVAATLATTIVNEEDRTVHSSTEALAAEQFGGGRAVDHRFELPLDSLTPGAYLLRFALSGGGQTAGRDVRFVVR